MIYICVEPAGFQRSVQRMIEVLLPSQKVFALSEKGNSREKGPLSGGGPEERQDQENIILHVKGLDGGGQGLIVRARGSISSEGLPGGTLEREFRETNILDDRYTAADRKRRMRDIIKKATFLLLKELLRKELNPWGTLIGVRPTKLAHYLRGKNFTWTEIDHILKDVYCLRKDKRELLIEVAEREESFIPAPATDNRLVSIYIGIPFCPTRCAYCSFPSYPRSRYNDLYLNFYLELKGEVKFMARAIKELGLQVDTIYVGGGTPTVLEENLLGELLEEITAGFYSGATREFCLEAGRPDTLTAEKLDVISSFPVDRITINPQTMNPATLEKIGRGHTIEEFERAFALARKKGFKNINADMIIGLPGEGSDEVENTLNRLLALKPEGITVHTLALKRGSRWIQQGEEPDLPREELVGEMLELVKERLRSRGFQPYYLYRQKYMVGNLENIGYALPEYYGLYNMIMMEERETVIGLGGGAVTKFVGGRKVERVSNPKFPREYLERWQELAEDKIRKLTSLYKVG